MTLDESIKHCYKRAEENRIECEECAKEHEQLAGWLEELKRYREIIETITEAQFHDLDESSPMIQYKIGWNDALVAVNMKFKENKE